MDASATPVVASGLRKTFALPGGETVHAVDDVSFTAEAGAITAITGPSGSGKSTLLQLLAGLDRPDAGSVAIGGTEISRMRDRQLSRFRRRHIGFVFQSFNLVPTLTARANIVLPLRLDGALVDEARLHALCTRLGIDDRLEHLPGQLSGGQQQRVAVARALLGAPDVVFADEPTGALDEQSAATLLDLFGSLAHEQRQTVVVVTHDPRVAQWADHVHTIDAGRMVQPATVR